MLEKHVAETDTEQQDIGDFSAQLRQEGGDADGVLLATPRLDSHRYNKKEEKTTVMCTLALVRPRTGVYYACTT